jgi:hypothetical protein
MCAGICNSWRMVTVLVEFSLLERFHGFDAELEGAATPV